MTPAQILPAAAVVFVGWRLYSRVRRNIGRQPYHPGRWKTTMILFSAVSAMLAAGALSSPAALGGLAGGLVGGAALAVVAFRLTRFEATPAGNFYTPQTTIGLVVTGLFVLRLAYRFLTIFSAASSGDMSALGASSMQSPLTLLTYGITAGFYIAYNAALLLHAHKKV